MKMPTSSFVEEVSYIYECVVKDECVECYEVKRKNSYYFLKPTGLLQGHKPKNNN